MPFLNIISESRHWLFMDKAVFITPDLLERTVKENRYYKRRIFYYNGGLINEHI